MQSIACLTSYAAVSSSKYLDTLTLFHACSKISTRQFLLPVDVSKTVVYSRTSLSRTRLFRITAYLEVKIWSLF